MTDIPALGANLNKPRTVWQCVTCAATFPRIAGDADVQRCSSCVRAEQAEARATALSAELERECLRLAACSVAALANTPDTAAERLTPEHPYYSASYGDVCAAVDREMIHRARATALQQALDEAQECLANTQTQWDWCEAGLIDAREERDAALVKVGQIDAWAVALADECAKLRASLSVAVGERDAAREALRHYGAHDQGCAWIMPGSCQCQFFNKLKAALGQPTEPQP